jgi:hypothetical protein
VFGSFDIYASLNKPLTLEMPEMSRLVSSNMAPNWGGRVPVLARYFGVRLVTILVIMRFSRVGSFLDLLRIVVLG